MFIALQITSTKPRVRVCPTREAVEAFRPGIMPVEELPILQDCGLSAADVDAEQEVAFRARVE